VTTLAPTNPRPGRSSQNDADVGRHGAWRLGVPFLGVHLGCLAIVFVGWSPIAVTVAVVMFVARMFGITGFYHRYFSHRSFTVSRPVQLAGALLGAAAAQRGPLWWAAHHRRHHRFTDRPGDPHSPVQDTMAWSHFRWIFSPENRPTDFATVEDLAVYPELRILDKYHHVVPAVFGTAMFGLGMLFGQIAPGWHTNGPQMLVWGFCVSTTILYHSTFMVNSVAHRFGTRRYDTKDDSRNVWWLALLTLGEGWHNNHHKYPPGARQGYGRFELDITWLGLRVLQRLGLVHGLRAVPEGILAVARTPRAAPPGA
jgi:stearoyl-CoA desaturase (delta-9 desaturase)